MPVPGGIKGVNSVSITPRRFISTVEGGSNVAHTAYIGWTKPVRVVHHSAGYSNRKKTELHATAVCGPVKKPAHLTLVVPTYEDLVPLKIMLHKPKEAVISGGTSVSKNSPSVIKMDRSFRNTFYGAHYHNPLSTRASEEADAEPRRRPVPRYFTDHKIQLPVQAPGGQSQSLSVDRYNETAGSAWIGEDVPRIQLHESVVSSPRMQRLLNEHPNIHLDHRPARLPCSLQPQPATLRPYKTDVIPYNPEYLWVQTDPKYKYRTLIPLSPRRLKRNGPPPLIQSLRQSQSWDKDNVSPTRNSFTRQNGNPKVMKLECTQNGFFDSNLISNARAELRWKEREHAKKVGMDKLLEEGRRELAALMVS